MTHSQFPPVDLAALAAASDPAPDPLPWWLEWDLIAIGCCLCIAAATFYAIGRLH